MKLLEAKNISVHYGSLDIVENISFSVAENEWLMIAGPNGAGKSTLINALSQAVKYDGLVQFNGKDVSKMTSAKRGRRIGVLTQDQNRGSSFTVEEIVRLGRYSYSRGIFSAFSEEDKKAVENALEITGLSSLRSQAASTLSGGEFQRTFLAQAFAQNPKILLLDEPTNHLDPAYQKQIFELIGKWVRQEGRAVVSVVHDLSLAKAFGSNALLLNGGHCVAFGGIAEVLNAENLEGVYGINMNEWFGKLLEQWH